MIDRPLCALAGAAVIATAALPAAAASFFTFDVAASFSGVSVNGVAVDQEFRLSGRSSNIAVPLPWDGSAVDMTLDTSSLSLTYGGADIGALLSFETFTFGVLGSDETPNEPATFRFTQPSGPVDFRPLTPLGSVVFKAQFGGVDTWIGFGGGLISEPGPEGSGGRRFGITTAVEDGVIQFGVNDILQSLTFTQNNRTATLMSATVVPLPAAGWLLLAALGGLGAVRLAVPRQAAGS